MCYNGHVGIPVTFHDSAVVGRWATISGASVGANSLIEPSSYQASVSQGAYKVCSHTGVEIQFRNQLLSQLAAEDQHILVFGILSRVGPVVGHQKRFWNFWQRTRSGASVVVDVNVVGAGGLTGGREAGVEVVFDVCCQVCLGYDQLLGPGARIPGMEEFDPLHKDHSTHHQLIAYQRQKKLTEKHYLPSFSRCL